MGGQIGLSDRGPRPPDQGGRRVLHRLAGQPPGRADRRAPAGPPAQRDGRPDHPPRQGLRCSTRSSRSAACPSSASSTRAWATASGPAPRSKDGVLRTAAFFGGKVDEPSPGPVATGPTFPISDEPGSAVVAPGPDLDDAALAEAYAWAYWTQFEVVAPKKKTKKRRPTAPPARPARPRDPRPSRPPDPGPTVNRRLVERRGSGRFSRPGTWADRGYNGRMDRSDLLRPTDLGLYCEAGDFFVDPWRPVARAVVTHAHADHACWGCGRYLTSADGAGVLRARMGREAIDRRPALRRGRSTSTASGLAPSGRAHPRVVAGPARASGRGLGRLGRLQGRARPDLRAVRAGPLPHLHLRIDLRPADLPMDAGASGLRRDQRLVAVQPRGGQGEPALRLRAGQGAAAARGARPDASARSTRTGRSSR